MSDSNALDRAMEFYDHKHPGFKGLLNSYTESGYEYFRLGLCDWFGPHQWDGEFYLAVGEQGNCYRLGWNWTEWCEERNRKERG